jgi:hypothetical protein
MSSDSAPHWQARPTVKVLPPSPAICMYACMYVFVCVCEIVCVCVCVVGGAMMLRTQQLGQGKERWSRGAGQTFQDENNPLYKAQPADKVMDPEERPFLR